MHQGLNLNAMKDFFFKAWASYRPAAPICYENLYSWSNDKEGQRARNMRQRQEIEDMGEGRENREEGTGIFVLEWNRLSLDRKEASMALRKMSVYEDTRKTLY